MSGEVAALESTRSRAVTVPDGRPVVVNRTKHTLPDGMIEPQSETSTTSPLPETSVIELISSGPGPVLRIIAPFDVVDRFMLPGRVVVVTRDVVGG
jgi:hypothetical protein